MIEWTVDLMESLWKCSSWNDTTAYIKWTRISFVVGYKLNFWQTSTTKKRRLPDNIRIVSHERPRSMGSTFSTGFYSIGLGEEVGVKQIQWKNRNWDTFRKTSGLAPVRVMQFVCKTIIQVIFANVQNGRILRQAKVHFN